MLAAKSYDGVQRAKDGSWNVVIPTAIKPPDYINPDIVGRLRSIKTVITTEDKLQKARRATGNTKSSTPTYIKRFYQDNFKPSTIDQSPMYGTTVGNTMKINIKDSKYVEMLKRVPLSAEQVTALKSIPGLNIRETPVENRKYCSGGNIQFDLYNDNKIITRIECQSVDIISDKLMHALNLNPPQSKYPQKSPFPNQPPIQLPYSIVHQFESGHNDSQHIQQENRQQQQYQQNQQQHMWGQLI